MLQLRWNSGCNILQLVQMRGGTQYNIICYATCTISFAMQLVQMRSIHTLLAGYCNLADEGWNSGCNIHVL